MKFSWFLHPLVILAVFLTGLTWFDETWQMPDKLSRAHKNLENDCAVCHPGFKGASNDNCLKCKIPMKQVLDRGIHRYGPARECSHCHMEHLGRDYPLAKAWVDPSNFDHKWTGFDLAPFHQDLTCQKCHAPGTPYHQAPWPCQNCHHDFKPGLWNHAKVGCRLDETHKSLPCQDCHISGWGPGRKASCGKCHPGMDYKPRKVCQNGADS